MECECALISDCRTLQQLGKNTISGYSRGKVKTALNKAILNAELEPACYWGAELLCSLKPEDFWEVVICFYGMHINVGSLNLAVYLSQRICDFKQIAVETSDSDLRNNFDVRRIFAEVTAVTSVSRRRQPVHVACKVQVEDFEMTNMSPKLRAPSSNIGDCYFRKRDPTDIHIPINELVYNVTTVSGDMHLACFWVDWLLSYMAVMRKAKHPISIEKRDWPNVLDQYKTHPVWLVWDCLNGIANSRSPAIARTVTSLCSMFSLRFRDSSCSKRRHVIYTAIATLIDNPRSSPPLCSNLKRVEQVKNSIDLVYKQIQKNQVKGKVPPNEIEDLVKSVRSTN
tara:strand:+ start:5946 stop:6965 length:1020 start_codon:yes stop_codon:yes gene_type:complete